MSTRNSNLVFANLKDFQQRTVNHALNRLYDAEDSTERFLVADEVGMGKTHVAKGVIAGAIERLDQTPTVDRIDIIYICSNSSIARQNIGKLDVLNSGSRPLNTRITMLASQVHELNKRVAGTKTVNLIAVTPGTSFERGWARGKVEERALIYIMLKSLFPRDKRGLQCLLRLNVKAETWAYYCDKYSPPNRVDVKITQRFRSSAQEGSLWTELSDAVVSLRSRSNIPKGEIRRASRIVGALRTELAKVSIDALEPDLVILDEFQRFKHLLEVPPDHADADDIRRLAQQLFNYEDVRVLLLSATPYKLFTVTGEESISGDDHYQDFLATIRFLLKESPLEMSEVESAFSEYRTALINGENLDASRVKAQVCLQRVMSRTERPSVGESSMSLELDGGLSSPTGDELAGFAAMDRLVMDLDTTLPVEYWKSAPYFLNFMDGYKIGDALKESMRQGGRRSIPKHAQVIRPRQIARRQAVEPGNARLRHLQNELMESGIWKLLWLPASLPYLEPGGHYSTVDPSTLTKRLIFSSWAAAPSSIAALLSHEVSRRVFDGLDADTNPYERASRLDFRSRDNQVGGMTTLVLVTPIPELALAADPLEYVRSNGGAPISLESALGAATEQIASMIPHPTKGQPRANRESWYWAAPCLLTKNGEVFRILLEEDDQLNESTNEPTARQEHLRNAMELSRVKLGSAPEDILESMAMLGMFGPGNVAYRALRRSLHALNLEESVLIRAAAIIGEGFRSLFNRPESMSLVDLAHPENEGPYWRRVLSFCADGDLPAVLDEYLFHLVGNVSPGSSDDVLPLAEAVRESLSLKTSTIQLFDPMAPRTSFSINTRFAVRYGSARGKAKSDDKSENRMSAVQQAFNSPFWPMVLASTSVGQEGVDFHWWCHSLIHWNLPANPVDLEQREGRIHRFGGHAVRKNVATAFRTEALTSGSLSPWQALFEAAETARDDDVLERFGDLWPYWVFPGEAKILTWAPTLPFSKDKERDVRLRRLREIYRLAFGQPRQEELLELLSISAQNAAPLDLRPPSS